MDLLPPFLGDIKEDDVRISVVEAINLKRRVVAAGESLEASQSLLDRLRRGRQLDATQPAAISGFQAAAKLLLPASASKFMLPSGGGGTFHGMRAPGRDGAHSPFHFIKPEHRDYHIVSIKLVAVHAAAPQGGESGLPTL